MEFFDRLGKKVFDAWRARNFDERIFHEVAAAELNALRPSDHVSPDEIVEWVHESPELPLQGDLKNGFGSPPIVVYRSESFFIEVLFWVDATTSIHQHAFSGAFHVLEGSSLHSTYTFRAEHRYSERLLVGLLELETVEHLRKGDVRVIRSSDRLIHSLFHLDRPSVSVVVRTNDPFSGPQYGYQRNGIAFDPFLQLDSCTRKVQTLELLRTLERPFRERTLRTLETADAFTTFHLLSWLGATATGEEYASILGELRSPHTALIERIRAQRDEGAREADLLERRKRIRSAEHRFFLALLLNIPSRKRILEVVAAAYPGVSPVDTVVRWVTELSDMQLDDGRNALAITMTPAALRILAHLTEGASDTQVIARLREEYGDVDDQIQDVRDLCEAFRRSLMFRTLFME